MKECFRANGRQLFVHRDNPDVMVLVFYLDTGELINCATLESFKPGDVYRLEEAHRDPAVYTFLAKYSDRWGDECIVTFASRQEANEYAAAHQIPHWTLQRVRVMEPEQ